MVKTLFLILTNYSHQFHHFCKFFPLSLASTVKTRYNYLAHKATDKELAAFLSYVNGKAAESSFTKNLDNEVKRIRDSEDWRFHAMYYEAETQFHEWLGERNAKYQIARNMLAEKIPVDQIMKLTGLTAEEVSAAAKEKDAVVAEE